MGGTRLQEPVFPVERNGRLNIATDMKSIAYKGAGAIYRAFDEFHRQFKAITARAAKRFERRDWSGARRDAMERLELYTQSVQHIERHIRRLLAHQVRDTCLWAAMKDRYSELIAGRNDGEIAETFFNSVTRRIFATVGVNPEIEFVDSDFEKHLPRAPYRLYRVYPFRFSLEENLRRIIADCRLKAPFRRLDRNLHLVTRALFRQLTRQSALHNVRQFEILETLFYRNQEAYIIGRIILKDEQMPFVLALLHDPRGIQIDAVLTDIEDVSIIFSFTRSYFHVQTDWPRDLVFFLKSIMPHKPLSELYNAIGYHKHGKTELYRALLQHLRYSSDRFQIAPGEKGMVMLVFDLPSFNIVFKVIKDRFAYPKTTSREQVKQKYQLVFKHDRVGRLVDAQEFEHLQFDRRRFDAPLLKEMQENIAGSIDVHPDSVVIHHLYTERKLTPLNLYLSQEPFWKQEAAVLDYGRAIKDLAAANIFPGDIFLKNFGVTRHGRVVFYDYDELTLLTDCRFRRIPPARFLEDELADEPWFHVGPNDVFPEEFATFLELKGDLRSLFLEHHGELLQLDYWLDIQQRLRDGEYINVLPYPQSKRLKW